MWRLFTLSLALLASATLALTTCDDPTLTVRTTEAFAAPALMADPAPTTTPATTPPPAQPMSAPVVGAAVPAEVEAYLRALAAANDPCPEPNPGPDGKFSPSLPFDAAVIEACVRDVWPDELEGRALAIVFGEADGYTSRRFKTGLCRESWGNPNAIGPKKELGVFQLHPQHFGRKGFATKLGYVKADAYDPRINAELAYYLYLHSGNGRSGGWFQWTCANRSWPKRG